VMTQTGPARFNGILETPGAPVFLGQRRKRNRRRIPLDPASKLLYTR
jgi:hypothetical protein